MYGVELGIMIAATYCLTVSGYGPELSIIGITVFWRVILGLGIGGDYPSSSIMMSEFASVRWRGAMIGLVFASQGLGQFAAALVFFICTARYSDSLQMSQCGTDCQHALDKSWRILYGIGILPACVGLFLRLTMPESIRYTLDVRRDQVGAAADARWFVRGNLGPAARDPMDVPVAALPGPTFVDFIGYFRRSRNAKKLIGTAMSWFLIDVAFVSPEQDFH